MSHFDLSHLRGTIKVAQHMSSFLKVVEELLGELQRQRLARTNPNLQAVKQLFRVLLQRQIQKQRTQKRRHEHQSLDLKLLKDVDELAGIFRHLFRHHHQSHSVQKRTPDLGDGVDKGQGRFKNCINFRLRVWELFPLPLQAILNDAVAQSNSFRHTRRPRRVENETEI